jgi:hypothetical protein
MPHITISYRRADSDAMAGRIRDKLASYYGQDSLFMDIDSIPVGIDFREQIRNELAKNDVLIVVVGPKWRGPGKGGRARINDENDPVRVEVETALQRGIPVVPVLVNGATMPKPEELPPTLRNFSFHNGAIVDAGQDFHQHMERLIRSLDRVLNLQSKFTAEPEAAKAGLRPVMKWAMAGAGVAAAVAAGAAGSWFFQSHVRAPVALVSEQKASPVGPVAGAHTPQSSGAATAPSSTGTVAGHANPPAATQPPAVVPRPSATATTPAPVTTPQVAAVQPTAKLAVPAGSSCVGTAAFEDDFRAPDAGWTRGLGPRDTGSNAFFADNRLVMKPAPKRGRTIVYPSLIFRSAAICATVQSPANISSSLTAGIAFWAADDRNLYALEIVPDGSYAVRRLIDNNWSLVVAKQQSDAIKAGPDAVNQLEVRIRQNNAEIYVNGAKLQEFKGQPPARESTVGFVVRNDGEGEYEWRFHNIGVFELK